MAVNDGSTGTSWPTSQSGINYLGHRTDVHLASAERRRSDNGSSLLAPNLFYTRFGALAFLWCPNCCHQPVIMNKLKRVNSSDGLFAGKKQELTRR